jgi:hypothetical protein
MARHDDAPEKHHEAEETGRAPAERGDTSADPADDGACADARRLMRHGLFGR